MKETVESEPKVRKYKVNSAFSHKYSDCDGKVEKYHFSGFLVWIPLLITSACHSVITLRNP